MDINKQLVKVQGKFDNTSLTLDIKVNYTHFTPYFSINKSLFLLNQGEVKPSSNVTPQAPANGRSSKVKVGELFTLLDGMRVDTKLLLTNGHRNRFDISFSLVYKSI